MPYIEKIALEKARVINSTPSIYGTFAEIGAGQEVVNHFFKSGQASKTVAKSMSAYDMTFSDEIYGRVGRYVSEKRLFKMLDHEYELLQRRLAKKRGHNTKFFVFADTVAVSTEGKTQSPPHGWMGVRFQNKYKSSTNEIILHVNLLDKTRLQQYEMLGILGVNLIYSIFYEKKGYKNIIKSLFDNFEPNRVDIDMLQCSGAVFKNLNHHQLNLELIRQKSTEVLLFHKKTKNILFADALHEKPILIQQYSSKKQDLAAQKKQAITKIQTRFKIREQIASLIHLPIQHLKTRDISYYLKNTTSPKNKSPYLLLSDFKKLYELKNFIRKKTDQYIFIILDISTLKSLLSPKKLATSKNLEVDMLEFFSRLCDSKTILLIPELSPLKKSAHFQHLEKYLTNTGKIISLK